MRVLITGAGGFLGGAIFRHLRDSGFEAIGTYHRKTPKDASRAKSVFADLRSNGWVEELLVECLPCDAIVHCAALLSKEDKNADITACNCLGTHQLLALANQWQTSHFVYLSGITVIGRPTQVPITESHPTHPVNVYAASKLYGEHLVQLASNDMFATSLRVTAPIGVGMQPTRILPVFVNRAVAGKPLNLVGKGRRRQNYVDAQDVASAVKACLRSKVSGKFNIGGPQCVSNLELAETCVRLARSKSRIQLTGTPDPEEGDLWDVSLESAARYLGYFPQIAIESSIRELIATASSLL